jgi:hypothetical protein
MFAAAWLAIGVVDENVVVTSGADQAVNGLAELLVAHLGGVLAAGLLPADCHRHPFCNVLQISNRVRAVGSARAMPRPPTALAG